MKDRIKKIRKSLDMTQAAFASRIGVKQNTIAQYEIGRNVPMSPVISAICREFNVNEEWLRHGTGDMFIELTRDEQIAEFIGSMQSDESPAFKKRFTAMLSALNEADWEVLEKMAISLHEKED